MTSPITRGLSSLVHPLERMLEDVGSSAAMGKSQAFHHVHPRLPDMPPWWHSRTLCALSCEWTTGRACPAHGCWVFSRLATNVFVAAAPQDEPAAAIHSSLNAVSGNNPCRYCFYHQKWVSNARSCSGKRQQPCTFLGNACAEQN